MVDVDFMTLNAQDLRAHNQMLSVFNEPFHSRLSDVGAAAFVPVSAAIVCPERGVAKATFETLTDAVGGSP